MLNSFMLYGRIAKKEEMKTYGKENTQVVIRFSVAVDFPRKPSNDVYFFDLVAFEKTALLVNKYFDKGDRVVVKGYLKQSSYEDKTSHKKISRVDLVADSLTIIETKKEKEAKDTKDYIADESIPF